MNVFTIHKGDSSVNSTLAENAMNPTSAEDATSLYQGLVRWWKLEHVGSLVVVIDNNNRLRTTISEVAPDADRVSGLSSKVANTPKETLLLLSMGNS